MSSQVDVHKRNKTARIQGKALKVPTDPQRIVFGTRIYLRTINFGQYQSKINCVIRTKNFFIRRKNYDRLASLNSI